MAWPARRQRLRHANTVIGDQRIFSVSLGEPVAGLPAIVCVHGLGVSSRYFTPLIRRLAPHTRVLAPDLPGFGRSSNPSTVYDVPQLAGALDAWLDAQLFDRPPLLVANSMGCQVVASLVDGRPERTCAVVLIGPSMDARGRTAATQIGRLIRAIPFERPTLLPVVAYEYLLCGPRRLMGTLRHALADPLEAHLPGISVPSLVVRGERDVIATQAWVEEVATLLGRGPSVTIPGTGHAVNFSAPDALLPGILRLLEA